MGLRPRLTGHFALLSAVLLATGATAQEQTYVYVSPGKQKALTHTRVINTAEVTYARIYGTGYSEKLAYLGETPDGVKASPTLANLVDSDLGKGRKDGYVFDYRAGQKDKDGKIMNYTLTARPATWHANAVSFFSDQTGVIRWTKENRAPNVKDPTIDSLAAD